MRITTIIALLALAIGACSDGGGDTVEAAGMAEPFSEEACAMADDVGDISLDNIGEPAAVKTALIDLIRKDPHYAAAHAKAQGVSVPDELSSGDCWTIEAHFMADKVVDNLTQEGLGFDLVVMPSVGTVIGVDGEVQEGVTIAPGLMEVEGWMVTLGDLYFVHPDGRLVIQEPTGSL